MKTKRMSNQNGYTLLEALMVLAIICSVAIGSASLLKEQMAAQSTYRFKEAVETVTDNTRNLLKSSTSCLNTLKDITLSPSTNEDITSIRDDIDNAVFAANSLLQDNNVRLLKISAKDYQSITATKGRLMLELEFEKANDIFGPEKITRGIQIYTQRDATNKISECKGRLNSEEGPWQKAGGDDKIYTHTKIAVGTSTPSAQLSVKGGKLQGQLDCRRNYGSAAIGVAVSNCDSDEYVIGGGGYCGADETRTPDADRIHGGYIHETYPLPDLSGWAVNCFRVEPSVVPSDGDQTVAHPYAICCKK